MKVAIAPFQDLRPEHEKNPSSSFSNSAVRDSMFKDGDVPRNMSEAFVTHLNHVRLFKTVEMTDRTASIPAPVVLEKLRGQGYDLLMTGKIKRFYGVGHATGLDMVAVGLALIPITAVVTIPAILAQPNDHETSVELIDLQLTDTSTGSIIWSGSFQRNKQLEYYDVMPVRAVSDTLKEIVQEVVKQIEAVPFESSGRPRDNTSKISE
jgi:TolB-like protein